MIQGGITRMFKYGFIFLLSFLLGCATTYSPEKTDTTSMTAIAEDQSSFYLLTADQPSYVFPKVELAPFVQFWQSRLGAQTSHLSSAVHVFPNKEVRATFYIYIAAHQLSELDKTALLETYQFQVFKPDSVSFVRRIPALAKALEHTDTLYIKQERVSKGRAVDHVPPAHQVIEFPASVETKVEQMKGSLSTTPNLVETIIWAPFVIPALPLGAISQ